GVIIPEVKRMIRKAALFDIVSVAGAIILFFTWLFQSTSLAKVDHILASLDDAEQSYRTYQSNNAIFNAIVATLNDNDQAVKRIRGLQTYNYGLGLAKMAELTGTRMLIGYEIPLKEMDDYNEGVHKKADAIREKVTAQKACDDTISLLMYGLGSLLALVGSAMKLVVPA